MNSPKGVLIAIGGAETKEIKSIKKQSEQIAGATKKGILRTIVEAASKKQDAAIEIISTASAIPDELGKIYTRAFRKLGSPYVGHLKITERKQAENKKIIERINKCNCVMFTGGDQLKLCSVLGGTPLINILQERYNDEYFVIAGTSAGAAAMSRTMMSGGAELRPYIKGEVELSIGFGFISNVIIDTHFHARGRFGRLAQAIATQPGEVGIGLDEDTGVIIERGKKIKAIGSGSVVIIDGSNIKYNNIADISTGMSISAANIVVNILSHWDAYDMETREFT